MTMTDMEGLNNPYMTTAQMGLLDSGASEIVRPYCPKLWKDIANGNKIGKVNEVILAGGH